MLIEDELKKMYLNYKIRKTISFLKKLTLKEKKESAVILKNILNQDWGYNNRSMPADPAYRSIRNQYEEYFPADRSTVSFFNLFPAQVEYLKTNDAHSYGNTSSCRRHSETWAKQK